MRKLTKVAASKDDPSFEEVDSNYISYYNKIENQAPIKTVGANCSVVLKLDTHYSQGNMKVYKLLHAALMGTNNLTHIKEFSKKGDRQETIKPPTQPVARLISY